MLVRSQRPCLHNRDCASLWSCPGCDGIGQARYGGRQPRDKGRACGRRRAARSRRERARCRHACADMEMLETVPAAISLRDKSSEERRGGKECVRKCKSRGSAGNEKIKK